MWKPPSLMCMCHSIATLCCILSGIQYRALGLAPEDPVRTPFDIHMHFQLCIYSPHS